jgi:hypothetical protein
MQIRASANDWHPDNPQVRPGMWIGGILGMALLAIAIMAVVGAFLNGDGSPFLS